MSSDINVQSFSGKVNITSNLLVGSSDLFVDTTNNRVGLVTNNPDSGLHVNSNAYVNTDFRVGSDIVMNEVAGRITADSFVGNGSGLTSISSDSGSWVNGSSSNIHLAVSTDKVGIGTATPMTKLDIECNAAQPSIVFSDTSNSRYQTGIGSIHISGQGQRLDFYTGDSGANGTLLTNSPRMSITGTGNVGIGTDEPETLFQIGSKAQTTGVNYLKIRGNNTSTFSDICGIIFNNSSNASLDGLRGESKIINERAVNNYGSTLAFYTNPADNPSGANPPGVNSVKRMVIDNDGNVGIPTTSEFKLDVGGSFTSGRSLVVRSGETNAGTDSIQILFGYANGLDYAHSIRTRHNAAGYDNAIDFWCWDTSTTASTYGNKRVMSVEAREIGGSREGLVTVHGVMIATSQPRWCWYGGGNGNWTSVGYLTYSHDLVTQTRIGGSAGGGYAIAQVAGVYYVSWCAFTENNVPVDTPIQYEIQKNNSGFMRNYHVQPKTNYSATGGLSCLIPLNVGDHVRVYIGSAVHGNANSCFSGFLVA
jgi:hypothetical protein